MESRTRKLLLRPFIIWCKEEYEEKYEEKSDKFQEPISGTAEVISFKSGTYVRYGM